MTNKLHTLKETLEKCELRLLHLRQFVASPPRVYPRGRQNPPNFQGVLATELNAYSTDQASSVQSAPYRHGTNRQVRFEDSIGCGDFRSDGRGEQGGKDDQRNDVISLALRDAARRAHRAGPKGPGNK